MLEFISEILAIIIAVLIFIPIYIKKNKYKQSKDIKCLKCGATFDRYLFLNSIGYCTNCGESFKYNREIEE